jgi:hypothetical protein
VTREKKKPEKLIKKNQNIKKTDYNILKIFSSVWFQFHKLETEKHQSNHTDLVKKYKIIKLKKPNRTETKPIITLIRKLKKKHKKQYNFFIFNIK